MPVTRMIGAVSITILLVASVVGSTLAQDDDVMTPMESPTSARAGGFAAIGLQLVDSTGSGDALIGATSPSASSVELHESTVGEGGAISMTAVEAIPVPAGGETLLQPGGFHLMLVEPVEMLAAGDTIDLELELEVAGTIPVTAVVVALDGAVMAPAAPASDLPTSISVEALDNFFVPDTLEAPANSEVKVKLLNYGFLPHNIAFYTDESATQLLAEGSLTPVIDPETEAIARFTTPGPGEYFILCVIHPEMTGTFIVR